MARRRVVVDSSDESSGESSSESGGEPNSADGPFGRTLSEEMEDEDASSSGSESDSDSSSDDLVDDEAQEDQYDAHPSVDIPPLEAFPQFAKLPPELRQRVWELFCPDLAARKGRLLSTQVMIHEPSDRTIKAHWVLLEHSLFLARQTEELRVVGSVHHESRSFVTKRFPHELPLHSGSGDAVLRFNGEQDIISIEDKFASDSVIRSERGLRQSVGDLCKNVQHVAFHLIHHDTTDDGAIIDSDFCSGMVDMLGKFPHVKTAFVAMTHLDSPINIRWTPTPFANQYAMQVEESLDGGAIAYALDYVFSWPDFVSHADFCKYNIAAPFRKEIESDDMEKFDELGFKILPLISFSLDAGMQDYEQLLGEYNAGVPLDEPTRQEDDEGDDDASDTPDEYESDGIDDTEVAQWAPASDEDDIMPGPVDAAESSETEGASEQAESGNAREAAPRGRKRRVVSDSEDDSDDQPITKRARTTATAPAQGSESSSSSSESESEDDKEEDDDDQPPARLSLAERLQKFRQDNPISSEEEGSVGAFSSVEGSDQDDDEDDDDDTRGGGFIDDMAESSEGDNRDSMDSDED